MKTCSICKIEKEFSEFHKKGKGFNYCCKLCAKLRRKHYYEDNKEAISIKGKKYRKDNKEKIIIRNAQYYEKNKEEVLIRTKHYQKDNKEALALTAQEYYETNKEEILIRQKLYRQSNKELLTIKAQEYYETNKEGISLRKKQYQQDNKEKIRIRRNKYIKEKRKNDPLFKLRASVSGSIKASLKRSGVSKGGESCVKYLLYSIEELKIHIQNQFEGWMNWYNWGVYDPETWNDNDDSTWTWQLDHIIPHSKFPYISMEDQIFRDCWSLSNLRPYSAKQNVLDGNRR